MDKGWNKFANTLAKKDLPRLAHIYEGFTYHVPAPGARITDGMLEANNAYPGLTIRYTTDGSEPELDSPEYKEPVQVKQKVKLRAFDAAGTGSLSVETE